MSRRSDSSVSDRSSSRMVGLVLLLLSSAGLLLAKPQFGSFNPSLNVQNCGFSQCQQNNVGGGGGGVYRPPYQPSNFFQPFSPSYNQQNCFFGQCQQNNFRRSFRRSLRRGKRKAEVPRVSSRVKRQSGNETEVHTVVCGGGGDGGAGGGLTGSSCVNSLCEIVCSDGELVRARPGKPG